VNGLMRSLSVHLIRVVLAILFAWLIGRFFFPGMSLLKTAILAAVLIGLAYLFEYTKKRDEEGTRGP
jgi:ABC-type sulfate transport system permease subunit